MAKYRQLHTTFWDDPLILDLTPEQKYFYIYLLTNPNVKQCGIYEISIKQISYHTGYNIDTIHNLLDLFEELGKIIHSKSTNEIAVVNFLKYNSSESPTVKKCIEKDLKNVKNKDLIQSLMIGQYLCSNDTVSIEYTGNNKNKNKKKKKENNNIEQSIKIFLENVNNDNDYKEYHQDFIDYWLEAGENEKPRFMFQKIFDIKKRLARWAKNQYTSNKKEFPDYWDKYLEKKLIGDKLNKYHDHLKKNRIYQYLFS